MLRLAALLPVLAALAAAPAGATADGPDFYRVTGIAEGESLALRAGPGPDHARIGSVPAGADGIANFGCRGGLSFAEWEKADAAERAAAAERRWCRVGHGAAIGWAQGIHLAEGGDAGTWRGGGRLGTLAGSEWQLRDFAAVPVAIEAWIRFEAEDRVFGLSGCNRFNGGVEGAPHALSFGPIAMTRMACPEPQSEVETRFMAALEATAGTVATHLLLALFDTEGRLLATLARRDWD